MPDRKVRTFYVETLGCQMNKLDSELVAETLRRAGYDNAEKPEHADVVLLNTCSVREHAETKAFSRVGHWHYLRRRTGRPAVIGMIGCFAQRDPQHILANAAFVDVLCGPGRLNELVELIDRAVGDGPAIRIDDFTALRRTGAACREDLEAFDSVGRNTVGRHQAFVRVQRGCDNFCSYCIVPYVRGPQQSRPAAHILDDAKQLDQAGCKEITLLGQAVSAYRGAYRDRTIGLAELLGEIHRAVSVPRIRFITSYPGGFPVDILHAMAELQRVCPYLHIPAQHGSNRMLKAMNRKYTVEQYVELIEQARAIVPELSLAGDFIAGFPGETDSDHRQSLALLTTARYKNCFVFKYSPRPGTLAERRYGDDVPDEVKTDRVTELLERQNQIALEDNRRRIGKTVTILVEGPSKKQKRSHGGLQLVGRTVDDKIVVFDSPSDLTGQILNVTIDNVSSLTLFAKTPCWRMGTGSVQR